MDLERSKITEFHYLCPIANVASIMKHGIVSNERAKALGGHSVADPQVQKKRSAKLVPGGKRLHSFVNLYFHCRNAMMWVLSGRHEQLCVLRVSPNVVDLPSAIVTDGNAASDYTRFNPARKGIELLNADLVYSRDWRHDDPIMLMRLKSARCAELLVPDQISASFILGVYVSCEKAKIDLETQGISLPITIEPDIFFRGN